MSGGRGARGASCVALLALLALPRASGAQVAGPPADSSAARRAALIHRADSARVAFALDATPAFAVPDNPIEPLAGRIAGARVRYPSAEPGTLPELDLRHRAGLPTSPRPFYLFESIPLAAPPYDLPSTEIGRIDVVPGLGGTARHGSIAAGGVVGFAPALDAPLEAGAHDVTARVSLGTQWLDRQYPLSRHHHFRVGPDGGYVDADGNPVTAAQRVAEADGVADNAYPAPVFDRHDALFEPGMLLGADVSVRRGFGAGRLAVSGGHATETASVRDGDAYRRTHASVSFAHGLGERLSLSLTGLHSRSSLPAMPSPGDYVAAAALLRPDVDVLAASPEFGYEPILDADLLFLANPLSTVFRDMDGARDRSIAGARLRGGHHWLSVDVGVGYDRLHEDASIRWPQLRYPEGTIAGFTNYTFERTRSRRTIDASATATTSRFGAELRGTLSGVQSRDMDVGEEIEGTEFAGTERHWDVGGNGTVIALGAEAVHRFGVEVTAGVRREDLPMLPAEDHARFHHVASVAFDAARAGWLGTSSVDRAALRLASASASRLPGFDLMPVGGPVFVGGTTLRPEWEHELELAFELRARERHQLTLAYSRARVTGAILPVSTFPVLQLQNAGEVRRDVLEATLGIQPVLRDDMEWSVELVVDRPRQRIVEFDRPPHSGDGTRWAEGAAVGEIWGIRFARRHEDLDPMHAGSGDAFVVNDDGLLVPVGAGGSLDDRLYGTFVTIDGQSYAWGHPISAAFVRLGDRTPDAGFGLTTAWRWNRLRALVRLSGQLGGDYYDRLRESAYLQGTHPDVDQSGKAAPNQKPVGYYRSFPEGSQVDWFVADATHLQLRELTLAYEHAASRIAIALVGRNLTTWFGAGDRRDELAGLPRPASIGLQMGYGLR